MNTSEQHYHYLINRRDAHTANRNPTTAQLLSDAGFEPVDDYILIERTEHGTRALSSDENVDVDGGNKEFFAFRGGTAFQLTINEHSVFWGEARIEIPELRRIGNVPVDHDLIWIREDQSNDVLPDQGFFGLRGKGTEHLRTHPREHKPVYIYFVGDIEFRTHEESLTGAQIIARIPDWNPADTLVLESEGSDPDEPIRPTTIVVFKGRATPAHFVIAPPATFGSA